MIPCWKLQPTCIISWCKICCFVLKVTTCVHHSFHETKYAVQWWKLNPLCIIPCAKLCLQCTTCSTAGSRLFLGMFSVCCPCILTWFLMLSKKQKSLFICSFLIMLGYTLCLQNHVCAYWSGCITCALIWMFKALQTTCWTLQVLQNRVENLLKQVQDAEDKAASLQLTVDRLSLTLSKAEQGENELKDKVKLLRVLHRWHSIRTVAKMD